MNEIKRQLRCILTERELLEHGKRSAELTREIIQLEDDKSRIGKDFGSRIASREMDRSILTDKITTGYEFRDVTCRVDLHSPKTGVKTVIRLDTMEEAAIEQMTPDEMQQELPLEPAAEAVDSAVLGILVNDPVNTKSYKKTLDASNQSTIRAAMEVEGVGSGRLRILKDRLAKLAEAKQAADVAAAEGDGFNWTEQGECTNPWKVGFVGADVIPFVVEIARHPADGKWYGGLEVAHVERDYCEHMDTDSPGLGSVSEVAGMMFENTRSHFEKRRRSGDKDARKMVAILVEKKSAFLYAVEKASATPGECSLA